MKERVEIKVFGLVQGVNFRYYTKERADSLRIAGSIKNNSDGSLDIEAEGESADLEEFIGYIRVGPTAAKIANVELDYQKPQNQKGFLVL